jgi:hypothetical protein
MQAKSIKGKSVEAFIKEYDKCKSHSFDPTLVILFVSIKQDRDALCSFFNNHGVAVFGATTSGEFIDGEMESGSIAALLLDIDPSHFKLKFLETGKHSTYENAKKIGSLGKETFNNSAFILATGWLSNDGESIVEGIVEGYGKEVTIFGGMAGDDLELEGPVVFSNQHSSSQGLLALIIDEDKVAVQGIATCGWKAIGIAKTITKSDKNIVYTIDDQPALDTIVKYLGVDINFDEKKEIVTQVGAYYPLQLEREGVAPVMRTAMFANLQDRSLICAGNVPQGSKIRFSLPPDFDAIEKVVSECQGLKEQSQPDADALIMFSCISRYLSFDILMSEEIEQVQQVWGAPMAGFFSYGEFGRSITGKHEFHNNTCCVVTLKEKISKP